MSSSANINRVETMDELALAVPNDIRALSIPSSKEVLVYDGTKMEYYKQARLRDNAIYMLVPRTDGARTNNVETQIPTGFHSDRNQITKEEFDQILKKYNELMVFMRKSKILNRDELNMMVVFLLFKKLLEYKEILETNREKRDLAMKIKEMLSDGSEENNYINFMISPFDIFGCLPHNIQKISSQQFRRAKRALSILSSSSSGDQDDQDDVLQDDFRRIYNSIRDKQRAEQAKKKTQRSQLDKLRKEFQTKKTTELDTLITNTVQEMAPSRWLLGASASKRNQYKKICIEITKQPETELDTRKLPKPIIEILQRFRTNVKQLDTTRRQQLQEKEKKIRQHFASSNRN